jgi:hypothetical protein
VTKLAYIEFASQEDADRAFQILRRDFEIAIEENVFCVPVEGLTALDDGAVSYQMAALPSWSMPHRRSWRILRDAPTLLPG